MHVALGRCGRDKSGLHGRSAGRVTLGFELHIAAGITQRRRDAATHGRKQLDRCLRCGDIPESRAKAVRIMNRFAVSVRRQLSP